MTIEVKKESFHHHSGLPKHTTKRKFTKNEREEKQKKEELVD
jgi:hypothetical protein